MTNLTRLVSLMWSISCLGLMLSNIFFTFTISPPQSKTSKMVSIIETSILLCLTNDIWKFLIAATALCELLTGGLRSDSVWFQGGNENPLAKNTRTT